MVAIDKLPIVYFISGDEKCYSVDLLRCCNAIFIDISLSVFILTAGTSANDLKPPVPNIRMTWPCL